MDEFQAEVMDRYDDRAIDNIDPLWNLSEDFSINDAAALVAGYNPAEVDKCRNDTFFYDQFPRYFIAHKAITNAITNGRLYAQIRYSSREYGYSDALTDLEISEAEFQDVSGFTADNDEKLSNDKSCFYKPFPDWSLSTVKRDNLVDWLKSRGIKGGFFFPTESSAPDFLDPEHNRYAPKLAAALTAWRELEDQRLIEGKSPKQALIKWLRENASKYNLSNDDGSPNETGIEECAKVANWRDKGGAPKTPN